MDLAGLAACNWLVTFEPPGGHLVPPGGHLVPPGGHLADTWLCLVAPLMLSRVELGQGEIKIRRKRRGRGQVTPTGNSECILGVMAGRFSGAKMQHPQEI
jgi:hypothetical protein